jgi:hypothetical protein
MKKRIQKKVRKLKISHLIKLIQDKHQELMKGGQV